MEKNNKLTAGKGEEGKWITVNGAHVFVEKGQSVKEAVATKFDKKLKVNTTLDEDKRKQYDEMGRKVASNRVKMKNADPKQKEKLASENRRLMAEMDALWDEPPITDEYRRAMKKAKTEVQKEEQQDKEHEQRIRDSVARDNANIEKYKEANKQWTDKVKESFRLASEGKLKEADEVYKEGEKIYNSIPKEYRT